MLCQIKFGILFKISNYNSCAFISRKCRITPIFLVFSVNGVDHDQTPRFSASGFWSAGLAKFMFRVARY